MRAIEVLEGQQSRVLKLKYAGKIWSGIRVSKNKNGEPNQCELSRFEGCVGSLTAETKEIGVDTEVFLAGEKTKAKK